LKDFNFIFSVHETRIISEYYEHGKYEIGCHGNQENPIRLTSTLKDSFEQFGKMQAVYKIKNGVKKLV